MGARGPKSKPLATRALEGNAGHHVALNLEQPMPTGVPVPPATLGQAEKEIWDSMVASCPPGQLTAQDGPALEAFCRATVIFRRAAAQLEAHQRVCGGNLLTAKGRPHGAWQIMREASAIMATYATRLGFSPADRNGIKLPPQGGEGRWAGLLA